MTLWQKISEKIVDEYEYAVSQEWIEKPMAYALYHVWLYVDAHEKKRGRKGSEDGEEEAEKADRGAGSGAG